MVTNKLLQQNKPKKNTDKGKQTNETLLFNIEPECFGNPRVELQKRQADANGVDFDIGKVRVDEHCRCIRGGQGEIWMGTKQRMSEELSELLIPAKTL